MEAALACFVERGFYGTAMPQIAEKAGVASGTIYHYFDSKEALVNALYRSWKTVVAQRVFMAFPQDAGAREQFRVMWNEMIAFLFLVFGVLVAFSTWRNFTAGQATGSPIVLFAGGGFALMLLFFGVTSLLRARRISRS